MPQRSNLIAQSTVCSTCPVSQAILGGDSSLLSTRPEGHGMESASLVSFIEIESTILKLRFLLALSSTG